MNLIAVAGLVLTLSVGMPPRPGLFDAEGRSVTTGDRYPVFPDWFGKPGPNKLRDDDHCETVTVLMQFPDNRADTLVRSSARFDSMLYSVGVYNTGPYRQGSLNDFFIENSYGAYGILGGVAGDRWFTSSHNYSRYYDGNYMLSTGYELAAENLEQVDAAVDFSQYDLDNDNHIDALFMVHAGPDGADDGNVNHCWSHAIPWFDYYTDDGVTIDGVTNVPEFAMVGPSRDTTLCCIAVMCHELGHLVGLPDLYDYSRYTWGVGYWGLMGYGAWGAGGNTPWSPSHMEAWSKVEAGFVEPVVITADTLGLRILDVETHPVIYQAWRNGTDRDTCFLLENRQQAGFDTPLPGPGLLVWHIDPGRGSDDDIVDLEEDSTFHLDEGQGTRPDPHLYHEALGDTSDPLPGNWGRTVFDNYTVPNSRTSGGAPTNVGIRNVRLAGDTVICDITFGVVGLAGAEEGTPPGRLALDPNPARGQVTFRTGALGRRDCIRLYDAAGALVHVAQLESPVTRIDLAGLAPGVYLARLGSLREKLVILP